MKIFECASINLSPIKINSRQLVSCPTEPNSDPPNYRILLFRDAWEKVKGLSKEEAMKQYVDTLNEFFDKAAKDVSNWSDPPNFYCSPSLTHRIPCSASFHHPQLTHCNLFSTAAIFLIKPGKYRDYFDYSAIDLTHRTLSVIQPTVLQLDIDGWLNGPDLDPSIKENLAKIAA